MNKLKFKQSKFNECLFYRGKTIYLLYTDDSILAGLCKKNIDTIIEDIKHHKLDITILGDLNNFLGVNINKKNDDRWHVL